MFSDEQLRVLENLEVAYDEWITAERILFGQGGRAAWKTVEGRDYLYLITDRAGNGRSLGPRSAETEAWEQKMTQERRAARARSRAVRERLTELAAQYRALRLPRIADDAARILVEADRRSLLGTTLRVVGTNAMAAYELEAMDRFATGLDATEDCDLSWAAEPGLALSGGAPLRELFKAVDSTYTVNLERPFQMRNSKAYEVEVLLPQCLQDSYPASEPIRPVALPEQDWLLQGTPVSQVLTSRRGIVCRVVVPDPRWFALHKRWLADKPGRNARKKPKDRKQAEALWAAVQSSMPRFAVDRAFTKGLPEELKPVKRQLDEGLQRRSVQAADGA